MHGVKVQSLTGVVGSSGEMKSLSCPGVAVALGFAEAASEGNAVVGCAVSAVCGWERDLYSDEEMRLRVRLRRASQGAGRSRKIAFAAGEVGL